MEEIPATETENQPEYVTNLKEGERIFKKAVGKLEECVLVRMEKHEQAIRDSQRVGVLMHDMTKNVVTIIGKLNPSEAEKFNAEEFPPVDENIEPADSVSPSENQPFQ